MRLVKFKNVFFMNVVFCSWSFFQKPCHWVKTGSEMYAVSDQLVQISRAVLCSIH